MKKNIFEYNRVLKPICGVLTKHNCRKVIGWNENFLNKYYETIDEADVYYKCKICGYVYFNHTPTKKELEFIKKNENND